MKVETQDDNSATGMPTDPSLMEGGAVALHEAEPQPNSSSSKLQPRLYQTELFEKARDGNTIAVLDTGSGKTFIAVMLINEMMARENNSKSVTSERKWIFFLVNHVNLVFQQAGVIAENCDHRVSPFCGSMRIDIWGEEDWNKKLDGSDIMVMTAQIFLNMLRHGYIKMSQVSLIVFDECHHAKKRHPYSLIMSEFYRRMPEDQQKPKIFGMSASPVNSKKTIILSANLLEANLDSQLSTTSYLDEIRKYVYTPQESLIYYNPSPVYPSTALFNQFLNEAKDIKSFASVLRTVENVLNTLGPWCADYMWQFVCEEALRTIKANGEDVNGWMLDLDIVENLEQLQLLEREDFFRHRIAQVVAEHDFEPPRRTEEQISPKVLELLNLLERLGPEFSNETNSKALCCIVFVECRYTAHLLTRLVQELEGLSFIKCDALVGLRQSRKMLGMRYKQQLQVIERFQKGEVNLLFATNVVEEGIDIQPCNVVIRFDKFRTLIEYIQCRGRARYKESQFFVMLEEGNIEQQKQFQQLKEEEAAMREWCSTLPEERSSSLQPSEDEQSLEDLDEEDDDDNILTEQYYIIPSTGALISLDSSISLLHQYCQSLPTDIYCSLKPKFHVQEEEKGYSCHLTLPINAPVEVREVTSNVVTSKKVSKRVAAFDMCVILHQAGQLDDHLNPPRNFEQEKHELTKEEMAASAASKRNRKIYTRRFPEFWLNEDQVQVNGELEEGNRESEKENDNYQAENGAENDKANKFKYSLITPDSTPPLPTKLYITILHLDTPLLEQSEDDEYRTLCLLTRKPFPIIPSFNLYFNGVSRALTPFSNKAILKIDKEKFEKLGQYTLKLVRFILNKDFFCDLSRMPYWIVPMQAKWRNESDGDVLESIAWEEVDSTVLGPSTLPLDIHKLEKLHDTIVFENYDNQRRFYVKAVRKDLSPVMPPPEHLVLREAGLPTFADFYKPFGLSLKCSNQPLIEVLRTGRTINYLQSGVSEDIKPKHDTIFIIPEFSRRFVVSASVFRAAMLLPSIMTRLDAYLLVQDFQTRWGLSMRDDLTLEAMTAPSVNLGFDYERLETLGDSILKLIVTIRLFLLHTYDHEGQLHHRRIRMISNHALYKCALRLEAPCYMSAKPFSRRDWRPLNWTARGDTEEQNVARNEHSLAGKQLADVVEACLGAGFLSDGYEGCIQVARVMIPIFEDMRGWDDFKKQYIYREFPLTDINDKFTRKLDVERVQELLGYQFRHPLLLQQAMTHASLPNTTIPCYQRLEFLGDAVLDFLVVKHVFTKYPTATPALLTNTKGTMVSNKVLAAICVQMGLDKHIIHYSVKLGVAMTKYSAKMEELKQTTAFEDGSWLKVEEPKVLGDIVESCLGAILVDSEFNMLVVQELFERCICPAYDVFLQSISM
ncbi:uncharacterized protein VTP21DRAFT_9718 [Calcarisporiella thermophila]|uniref:uncharacterized protein n=1 Tax=Calcarisporiella thermophila TaxID=911321 RepID=UPI003743B9BC